MFMSEFPESVDILGYVTKGMKVERELRLLISLSENEEIVLDCQDELTIHKDPESGRGGRRGIHHREREPWKNDQRDATMLALKMEKRGMSQDLGVASGSKEMILSLRFQKEMQPHRLDVSL